MAEIRVNLTDYLGRVAARRFDWVSCNCFLFCADWVKEAIGRDPAERWRGRFADKDSASRLLRREGGPRLLAKKAMLSAGCSYTAEPCAGDVALVMAPIGKSNHGIVMRPTGAICVGDGKFAILTVDLGLVIAPLSPVMSWSVWPRP